VSSQIHNQISFLHLRLSFDAPFRSWITDLKKMVSCFSNGQRDYEILRITDKVNWEGYGRLFGYQFWHLRQELLSWVIFFCTSPENFMFHIKAPGNTFAIQTRSITVHPVVSDREIKPATEYVSAHSSSQFIQHHSYHDAIYLSNYRVLYPQHKCFFVERLLEVLGFDLEICWDSWMGQID